ncbi:MAG: energy transducer TonB [Bacteroidales bacterium]
MSRTARWMIAALVAMVWCVAGPATARAQDTLAGARELYGSAAYQDALQVLEKLKAAAPAPDDAFEIEKYRAFCLLAMARTSDAEQVVAQMFETRPRFVLDEREASPRVVAAFRDIRRRQLPTLVQQAYTRGRDAYDQKRFEAAAEDFRLVNELAADPDVPADRQLIKDLQTLSAGFLALIDASKPEPPKPPPVAPPPVVDPPSPPPRPFYTTVDRDVTPPVVINQEMPPWPSGYRIFQAKGLLEVLIDEKGQVESATWRTRIQPLFDAAVLERAKTWQYRPATRAGQPVKYLKRVEIATQPPALNQPK